MSKLTFYRPPDIQKGYIFNPQKSFFSVVVPEETTNLIYNPETQHLNDFAVVGEDATMELDLDEVLFGVSSIHATLYQDDYVEHDLIVALTPDTIYTFSVYLKGTGSLRLAVYNETASEIHAIGSVAEMRSELWTRHIFKFNTPAMGVMENANIRLISASNFSDFHISGLQLEQKPYATTFCSGNQTGLITGEYPKPYFWTSTPHYSPSVRLLTTRDGGKIVSLETLGFHVTGFNGFGLPEFDIVTSPVASGIGSVYQGSVIEDRDIEICGVLMSPTVRDFFCGRAGLGHSFRPSISSTPQPLKLLYSIYECDKQVCEQIEILAVYESGLEGQIESLLGEEICISLKMLDPLFKTLGNKAKTLNVFKEVTDGVGIVGTDINGEWQEMSTETDMWGQGASILDITIGPDNNLYIGGVANTADGDATVMARWNGIGFDSIGRTFLDDKVTPSAGYDVSVIIAGPNNTLYVGGHFRNIGNENGVVGVQDGDGANIADTFARLNIARYDISTNTWEYIGRFLGASGKTNVVTNMKLLHDGVIDTAVLNGKIMIVGNFRNPEGIDETIFSGSRNIITFDPATGLFETSVPAGNNDLGLTDDSIIYGIDQAPNGEIWIGGDFTFLGSLDGAMMDDIGGHLVVENVAVWGKYYDNTTNTVLGFEGATGVLNDGNIIGGRVNVVRAAPDGNIYIGGDFTADQIYDEINPDYPPHIQISDTSEQNMSAAFGFAKLQEGLNPNGWYSPFILGSMKWESGDEYRLGTVNDIAIDQNGYIHIVGTFTFANTYFPNRDFLDEPASASSHTVIDALMTQANNCNGYIIWDGTNFIQPDIYLVSEYNEFLDAADPVQIGNIELGALYANRFAEHSSAPNPNNFEYHLPGTGGANINPSFGGSVFISPANRYDFVSKDIQFVDLECNDFSKPIFVINGPGKLKSIINETTGDAIYFNYDMIEGESLVLDLTQPLFTLISNYRGNLRSIINPNSTISSFNLTGESMAISVNLDLLEVGENTNTSFMKWKKQYWSIDKACGCSCQELGTYND
jgi:hypothetical protein